MLSVPLYTLDNYQKIIATPYQQQDTSARIPLSHFLGIMDDEFIDQFCQVDARQLGRYIQKSHLSHTVRFADKDMFVSDVLVATKLLMPTLWTCHYFYWDVERDTHGGIDILLPQGTPISSFCDGKVVRIKRRDGKTQDEGNTVVVKSKDDKYYSYKHLDMIGTDLGVTVKKGDIIGTCGSTGQATQYHLHFQIDNAGAPFMPYRSTILGSVLRYTIDPLPILQHVLINDAEIFEDMPYDIPAQQAIVALHDIGVIKGHDNQIFPDQSLLRYEAALLIHRLAKTLKLYHKLPIEKQKYDKYLDVDSQDLEFREALQKLQLYGIMHGNNGYFHPNESLRGEHRLALLGRLFYQLDDAQVGDRYDTYVSFFTRKNIMSPDWPYIGEEILRKEVFTLTYQVLRDKKMLPSIS